jgi:hypothetical protein
MAALWWMLLGGLHTLGLVFWVNDRRVRQFHAVARVCDRWQRVILSLFFCSLCWLDSVGRFGASGKGRDCPLPHSF